MEQKLDGISLTMHPLQPAATKPELGDAAMVVMLLSSHGITIGIPSPESGHK